MKQSTGKGGRAWFWAGVVLLSICALLWLFLILIMVFSPEDAGIIVIVGLVLTFIPIGIGIYGVWRGSKAKVAKETTDEQMFTGEDAEILVQQKKAKIATHKTRLFGRLSWLIVIAFPILAIIVAVVFTILDLSVWLLLLTLCVTLVIVLWLLNLTSKRQASYFKESASKNQGEEEYEVDNKGVRNAK